MFNKSIILGNLTRDIEIRYSQSGSAIGNTGIASSRKFKTAAGEQKEEVLFIDLTFFGKTAEVANQYLRKGSKILVEGRIKLDQWTAEDGSKKSKHTVTVDNMQMLDPKPTEAQPMQSQQQPQQGQSHYAQPQQQTQVQQPQQQYQQQPQQQQYTQGQPVYDQNGQEIPV